MFNKKSLRLGKFIRSRFGLTLIALVMLVPLGAIALGEAEIESQIESVLMQRHPQDTPAWWRGLGSEAPPVIMKMYRRTDNTYHQIRLLEGLSCFEGNDAAIRFLKEQAEVSTNRQLRNAAVKGVGFAGGASEAEFVGKYLANQDPQTRLVAAQTLQAMEDAKADEKLKDFRKKEKVAWVLSRLQNEYPKPVKPLNPAASSEDRLNPALNGSWKGYWVFPNPEGKGMSSVPAHLALTVEGASALKGELSLTPPGGKPKSIPVEKIEGKKSRIQGALAVSLVGNLKKPLKIKSVSFEGEILEQAGSQQLRLLAPAVGGIFVLRKDS